MLRLKYLTAPCVATISLALLTFGVAPASAFTMTFDEYGNCSSTVGTCSSVVAPDPTGLVSGNVLIFTLPSDTFVGNVNIFEPGGVTISDRLRWYCSLGAGNCGTGIDGRPLGDKMIFYSFDSNGAPADVGNLISISATTNTATENPDGTFTYDVPSPGVNIYKGLSTETPLPTALPLFATGLGALGLLGRRRKRKPAPN